MKHMKSLSIYQNGLIPHRFSERVSEHQVPMRRSQNKERNDRRETVGTDCPLALVMTGMLALSALAFSGPLAGARQKGLASIPPSPSNAASLPMDFIENV